jgi:hypothetical protein
MTNRFMMSVAAVALIAGTGFANAQGTGTNREAPSGGSTVQQSAPSSERAAPSSATPMNRSDDSKAPAEKTTQSDQKSQPNGAKSQRAQDDMKASPKGEKSAQDNNPKGEKSKSMSSENDNAKGEKSKSMSSENDNAKGAKDMKAEDQGRDRNNMNAEQKGTTDSKTTVTTGQAGAGAKLSGEQRTKITSVIREQHVQPVTHVDFDIRAGVRVPRTVSFHPLPAEVVTLYPEWRGYEYFLVNDQIIVVNPRTLEIVDVIDV